MTHHLPVDPDAEKNLLGSIWAGLALNDPESRAALWEVPPEAFFIAEHKRLWRGMQALAMAGKEASELALAWEAWGGRPTPQQQAAVFEILSVGADLGHAPLKGRVLEMFARRTAITSAREIITAASDFAMPVEDVLAQANAGFLAVARGPATSSRFWSSQEMLPTVERGEGFRQGADAEKLLYFGVPWMDEMFVAMPGNVTLLGGRPGGGKTGLALQARNVTALAGIRAGFFSLEMTRPELDARDAAWWFSDPERGRIYAYKDFLLGNYDSARALAAYRESGNFPAMGNALSWHHPSGIPVGKLAAFITEAVHAHGIRLAIIDYFQYIGLTRQKGDNLASAYAANSQAIKRLAQELKIHILLLSQLSRDEEGKIPKLTAFKETSQLEQDASAAAILYRDKDNALAITIPKHRDGEPVETRPLRISWPCLRFGAVERATDQALVF